MELINPLRLYTFVCGVLYNLLRSFRRGPGAHFKADFSWRFRGYRVSAAGSVTYGDAHEDGAAVCVKGAQIVPSVRCLRLPCTVDYNAIISCGIATSKDRILNASRLSLDLRARLSGLRYRGIRSAAVWRSISACFITAEATGCSYQPADNTACIHGLY